MFEVISDSLKLREIQNLTALEGPDRTVNLPVMAYLYDLERMKSQGMSEVISIFTCIVFPDRIKTPSSENFNPQVLLERLRNSGGYKDNDILPIVEEILTMKKKLDLLEICMDEVKNA